MGKQRQRKPKSKKRKAGFLKKAMKEVANDSKARRINSIGDYNDLPINSRLEAYDLEIIKRKDVVDLPHHLQEQQSSLQNGEAPANQRDDQKFKLDTAFEKNFRNIEEKIKKLPKTKKEV